LRSPPRTGSWYHNTQCSPGHLGAGSLKGRCKSVTLGALFFAALLLGVVLWVLVLSGVEAVRVPAEYRTTADITFDFPYSHSLVGSVVWSLFGAEACMLLWRNSPARTLTALVVVAAVFSQFVLDWLVHIPELPLSGNDSPKFGLGLWRNRPVAWCVEDVLSFTGLWFYLRAVQMTQIRKTVLILVMLLGMGQARQAPPPTAAQMASSSLITILLLVGLGFWIDRRAGNDHTAKS
jgi:hypothetical protein